MRIAIALCLFTATATAGNHEVTYSVATRALRTSSANAVTDASLFGNGFGYGHILPIDVFPGLELWAEGTFAFGVADGTMFQTLSTEVEQLMFTVGARARYELWPRIVANARLDLGAARTALAIHDDAGHTASDDGWGALTTGALGLELEAIRARRLTLGLRFELGFTATTSVPLTASPESNSEDTLQLEMTAASLGSLNLSGPMFAGSIVSVF